MPLDKILTILEYFEKEALTERWVTNLQPEKTAQDLVRNGFTPEEVWRYLEARCPIPCKAAELRASGITPDIAGQHYGYDEDDFPMTLGEAYCSAERGDEPLDYLSRS